ncbi:hypothetical protein HPC37_02900 [Pasteurellaceae bacterium 20609_3]|nr:hypothetical protein [Spirabiliibacterium mucosae]
MPASEALKQSQRITDLVNIHIERLNNLIIEACRLAHTDVDYILDDMEADDVMDPLTDVAISCGYRVTVLPGNAFTVSWGDE